MGVDEGTPARGRAVGGLGHRLRRETSELHHAVEVAVDLPRSVRSRADYVALLTRLHRFHSAAETLLARPVWRDGWSAVGIDLGQHVRSPLLARDLRQLRAPRTNPAPVPGAGPPGPDLPEHSRFGEALGCLYVLEGSSLGGRVLAPALRHVLGDVPTAFFDSDGRRHPSPWRALQEGLHRYEAAHGDPDDVLRGARATFVAFGRHVADGRTVTGAVL